MGYWIFFLRCRVNEKTLDLYRYCENRKAVEGDLVKNKINNKLGR